MPKLATSVVVLALSASACSEYTTDASANGTDTALPADPSTESVPEATGDDDDDEVVAPVAAVVPASCTNAETVKVGHGFTSVACPTHLGLVDYWSSAGDWAKLDAVPVTVAILEQVFNTEHPDLKGAFERTYDFGKAPCAPYDATNAACVSVMTPERPNPDQLSSINHGTVIAGVIAGRGKVGEGIVGVNPSAKLIGVGRDVQNDNLKALAWAIEQKPDVITMSWPLGPAPGEKEVPAFEALLEEATAKGIVVVMAAGNTRSNVDDKALYPTRYSAIPGVIAVGATDDEGAYFANFSNYGPKYVDLGAPGKVISSGGDYQGALYSVQVGTSFSGPMVAGAASRVIQYLKNAKVAYTPADVEKLIVDGSTKDPALTPYFKDGARLDLTALHAHLTSKF